MDKTLDYYNQNAQTYCEKTLHADMSYPYQRFTFYLHKGNKILDLGCGSGRDTIWFRKNGYIVDAVDGSPAIAEIAADNIGSDVKISSFDDLQTEDEYDGVFASASLLHVPYEHLRAILEKVFASIKKEGILYASFKYGNQSEWRNGRYYTDMNEERLLEVIGPCLDKWTVLELWHSHDSLNRDEIWFNMILRRLV